MPKDLYSILELPQTADSSEIRKSYLKLSRQYHPDKASESDRAVNEAKFKEISTAYEILNDSEKKAFYDQTGEIPGENSGGGGMGGGMPFPFGGMGGGMGGGMHFDMNDLFGMFGGGGRGGSRGSPGMKRPGKSPSRKTQIALTLKDFYYGRSLEVHLERMRFCEGCKGEGSKTSKACSDCNGQGVKKQIVQMGPMIMQNVGPCNSCRGSGKTQGDPCDECKGTKFHKQDKNLELIVKKGMKPGDTVVFDGASSNVEEYQEAGDVIIELQPADEDSTWIREGPLLKETATITLGQSLAGTKLVFGDHPGYPNGLVLEIPSGIQNKETLVFVGLGMPIDSQRFGDLHLTILVKATQQELGVLQINRAYFQGLFPSNEIPSGDKAHHAKAARVFT